MLCMTIILWTQPHHHEEQAFAHLPTQRILLLPTYLKIYFFLALILNNLHLTIHMPTFLLSKSMMQVLTNKGRMRTSSIILIPWPTYLIATLVVSTTNWPTLILLVVFFLPRKFHHFFLNGEFWFFCKFN
jgi:hypothetical protein